MNTTDSDSHTLFDSLVNASGLATMIAASALTRALVRAGVAEPREITRAELSRALPTLRQALRVYLTEEQTETRMRAITALAGHPARG